MAAATVACEAPAMTHKRARCVRGRAAPTIAGVDAMWTAADEVAEQRRRRRAAVCLCVRACVYVCVCVCRV